MLKLEDLLGKGYFPKELPPPFTSQMFAQKFSSINTRWTSDFTSFSKSDKKSYSDSRCLNFSIPKVGFSRRQISIPNPLHQSSLSKSICDDWDEIQKIYDCSPLTASKPIIDSEGKRSVTTIKTYKQFQEQCFLNSDFRLYLTKTDISRYYPTIYTHIIPWAIHGKKIAKEQRHTDSLLGNILDRDVRNTQSGQTMGIPIGPDTSLIIAEIIACKIDEELCNKIDNLNGARFYDDYFLFFSDYASAEKCLKFLQSILSVYHLDINEEKTKIERFPIPFDNSWAIFLSNFEFRNSKTGQATDLYRYCSLAFEYAQKNPNDSVLKYAIKRLKFVKIKPDNWNSFESLLLKYAIIEPSTLPDIVEIFMSYESHVHKDKAKQLAQEIINTHYFKGHSFEVSWSLWLLRSLNVKIDSCLAKKVITYGDPISVLILLEMRSCGLINDSLDTSSLESELALANGNSSLFFDDKWLLIYESVKKGWLEPPDPALLSSNAYFHLLSEEGIQFYDENKQEETTPSDDKYCSASNNMVITY